MRLFAIDSDNTITAFPAAEQIPEGQEQFASEKELAKLSANWPGDRLIQIWNSFAGVAGFGADLKPVKKFTDRKSAVSRIWKAIQRLDAPVAQPGAQDAPVEAPASGEAKTASNAPKPKKRAKKNKAKAAKAATTTEARPGTKKAKVLDLIRREKGATNEEIQKATGWQPHTVRGFLSIAGKTLTIETIERENAIRAYRLK